jgi:hypothetical protein
MLTIWAGQQDDTPAKWDTKYYSQTQAQTAPRGVYRFAADVNLANPNTTSGEAFTEFANNKAAWATAFQQSMYKLSVLGLSDDTKTGLQDCTTGIVGTWLQVSSRALVSMVGTFSIFSGACLGSFFVSSWGFYFQSVYIPNLPRLSLSNMLRLSLS